MQFEAIAQRWQQRRENWRRLARYLRLRFLRLVEPPRPNQIPDAHRYSAEDLLYMQSLAAAVVEQSPHTVRRVLSIAAALLLVALLGMAIAPVDITVRGVGKVIPSQHLQVIQSLEGGVVAEILVHEGDTVAHDQPLMKLSDVAFSSSFGENRAQYFALKAKIARLRAEAQGGAFVDDPDVAAAYPALLEQERTLYTSNRRQQSESLSALEERVRQSETELSEAEAKKKQLQKSVDLIRQEIAIKEPLVVKQLVSAVEFLQLKRQAAELEGQLDSVTLSIPRMNSKIAEARRKHEEARLTFRGEASKQLNEAEAETARLSEVKTALDDRVQRTTLRAPVRGTVKRIHVNTVGGVLKPGSDVIEIVPAEDAMLVEVRIKPSDIANIQAGMPARVKFSAYDFTIYGSVPGTVTFVSADTITDDKGESFYLVRIKPERNYLGPELQPLPVRVGMTSEVDVLTGKRTILQYLMKPISRAMHNALREK